MTTEPVRIFSVKPGDKTSYISKNPTWKPTVGVGAGGKFGLRDRIGFVESH